jgi:DNA polymerase-3 subunit epsilon
LRQVVLDTETTGLEADRGHRIIEVGCVELLNRRASGRHFHRYINPERVIEAGAHMVHGITAEKLAQAPRFADIAAELIEFIAGSELIIHNAVFDLAFLDMELGLLAAAGAGALPASVRSICQVLDTLLLARARHPGQRNNLDALCKRYSVDNSHRELHGALLDARLLADVYLAMTGGQSMLALDEAARERSAGSRAPPPPATVRPTLPLAVVQPTAEELAAHAQLAALLQKSSGGHCLWLALEAAAD